MSIQILTTEFFDEFVEQADGPLVVDFWATWCAPCKMMLPILEQLSEELKGKAIIAKVDVDAEPEISQGITSVPTIKIYVGGTVVKELVGAKNKLAILKELEEYLDA